LDFFSALEAFRLELQARGNIEPRTIAIHEEHVGLFHRKFPGAPSTWTKFHVRAFLANPRWSQNTKRIRWKALNAFALFLVREGVIETSFMGDLICPPAGPARRPPKLDDDDIRLLLRCCPHWTWIGKRDQALVWMLHTTPFRKSEFAALATDDLDFARGLIRTKHSKGKRPYFADLDAGCAAALRDYLASRPFASPAVWITDDGQPMSPNALTQALRRIEKKAHAAGLGKHIYFHAFRHNFGMQTVRWGLSSIETARAMGQSSEKSAHIYTQWVAEEEALKKIRNARRAG